MGKFNLSDILNNASLSEAGAERKQEEKKAEITELDLYSLIPSPSNFYSVENLSDLLETIPLMGVMQPLLVKPAEEEPGMYDIMAGHRRWHACRRLYEERGLEQCRKLPCIIKEGDESENDSDIMNRLTLILSNRYRTITDYEKMTEVVELEKIFSQAENRKGLRKALQTAVDEAGENRKIKSRDIIADFAGISSTQVGRYKAIHRHLSADLMEAFKENLINVSAAYEASGLSERYMAEAYKILQNSGQLTVSHIQGLKQKERENTPIKGQMSIPSADVHMRENPESEKLPVPVTVSKNEKERESERMSMKDNPESGKVKERHERNHNFAETVFPQEEPEKHDREIRNRAIEDLKNKICSHFADWQYTEDNEMIKNVIGLAGESVEEIAGRMKAADICLKEKRVQHF